MDIISTDQAHNAIASAEILWRVLDAGLKRFNQKISKSEAEVALSAFNLISPGVYKNYPPAVKAINTFLNRAGIQSMPFPTSAAAFKQAYNSDIIYVDNIIDIFKIVLSNIK